MQNVRQVTHWGSDTTGRHFADGVFEWIFLDPQDLIVFQIKLHWDWFHAWFTLLTHICVTQTEWVDFFGSSDTCTIHITSIWNLVLNIFCQDDDYIMDTPHSLWYINVVCTGRDRGKNKRKQYYRVDECHECEYFKIVVVMPTLFFK